jgi:hypothetical protein
MHDIEPFYRWLMQYDPAKDTRSPFYGKKYNYNQYSEAIYNYYIDPAWDYIGSETLYIKILYTSYDPGFTIIELIGEWNDAISNDIMYLKRNIFDHMARYGIKKYILIGEHVFNFHGSDDCYYEEWFEDIEDGWIAAIHFRDFIHQEWKKFRIDFYINFGGSLEIEEWRTLSPVALFRKIDGLVLRRLSPH